MGMTRVRRRKQIAKIAAEKKPEKANSDEKPVKAKKKYK